jgi:hypothetical protein
MPGFKTNPVKLCETQVQNATVCSMFLLTFFWGLRCPCDLLLLELVIGFLLVFGEAEGESPAI